LHHWLQSWLFAKLTLVHWCCHICKLEMSASCL
jgi:hypothetical protein